MINLGDYLGHLLSEIIKARVQADMETLRIAEIYVSNPLLKHFPVPKIRMPNVELNVPVIISKTPNNNLLDSVINSKAIIDEIKKITKKELTETLKLRFSAGELSELNTALSNKAIIIDRLLESGATKETIVDKLTKEVINESKNIKLAGRNLKEKEVQTLQKNIKSKLYLALLNLERSPERIKIIPLTSMIKEIGNTDNVVTLKLSLTEDSVEWSVIDRGNNKTEKILVPE